MFACHDRAWPRSTHWTMVALHAAAGLRGRGDRHAAVRAARWGWASRWSSSPRSRPPTSTPAWPRLIWVGGAFWCATRCGGWPARVSRPRRRPRATWRATSAQSKLSTCSEASATSRSRSSSSVSSRSAIWPSELGVARAEAQAHVLVRHHLAQAAGVGHEAGAARGHRLERHQPERLVDRGHHRQVGDPVERVQHVVADPAEEGAVLVEAELARLLAQLLLVRCPSRRR